MDFNRGGNMRIVSKSYREFGAKCKSCDWDCKLGVGTNASTTLRNKIRGHVNKTGHEVELKRVKITTYTGRE